MSDTFVEEEPSEVTVFPNRVELEYKILTEIGGSPEKHSARHDETFGGPEYEQINSDDVEVEQLSLVCVNDLDTGEEFTGREAHELVEYLIERHGDFIESGFVRVSRKNKWVFSVPKTDLGGFSGGPYEVRYGIV